MSARKAELNSPTDIFVSSINEVYICDSNNHVIRKILTNGNIVTIAGTEDEDDEEYEGDIRPATEASLNNPRGIFLSNNEVYFADCANHVIRKILANGYIVTIAGTGRVGYSGDNGPATRAKLNLPRSVFVLNNEVYFSDCGNRVIRKILANGNIVTIAGNGKEEYSGDNGPAIRAGLSAPMSVFAVNNEVYLTEGIVNRIRKILANGNIVTIAGNGKEGYDGDNGPAISAKLNSPSGLFVSNCGEVYFTDSNNHVIRKILANGNIITIAGNGKEGYDGDNGLATRAILNYPRSVFVSNNEVYFTDRCNNAVRKILTNGDIVTIAGNGDEGYSGDVPFDITQYPHIHTNLLDSILLKKHVRDQIFGSEIHGFKPLLEYFSPHFSKYVLSNEKFISLLSSTQKEIIQQLIDSLIYEKTKLRQFQDDEILEALLILGLFKNREFIDLKRSLTFKFINSLTLEKFPSKWEQVEKMLKFCNEELLTENYILEKLNIYCAEFATVQLKTSEQICKRLNSLPVVSRNYSLIVPKMAIKQPNLISLDEILEIKSRGIEMLYNDETTSDIKIKMGPNSFLHCHKTILSSSSSLFHSLFESGASFSDLSEGIFVPEASEDLELFELVIKQAYQLPIEDIDTVKIFKLLDMAMKHENQCLVNYCKNNLKVSVDNYFDVVEACQQYLHLEVFKDFYKEILRFGIENRKKFFTDRERIDRLPEELLKDIVMTFGQNY